MPASVWLVLAAIFLVPPGAAVALVLWARRLQLRAQLHPAAAAVAYVLAAAGGLAIGGGVVHGIIRATVGIRSDVEPSAKARVLAEGISEAMNSAALGLLIVLVGVVVVVAVGVWPRRRRE
jgi:hypothetical protein